jgi:hypothetical protein
LIFELTGGGSMRDMLAHLEKLRRQISECERLQKAAKGKIKRDIFKRLATHYRRLARELEAAIAAASQPIPDGFLGRKTYDPFPKEDDG